MQPTLFSLLLEAFRSVLNLVDHDGLVGHFPGKCLLDFLVSLIIIIMNNLYTGTSIQLNI